MSNPAHLVFMGLPGSGKTTFLAALWHVLESRGSTTSLKLTNLGIERAYLDQIADEWRACSQMQRTNLQTEEMVTLHLDGDGFGAFELTVPDRSGEVFEQQLTDRRMSAQHDELLQRASGVVLFVHSDVQKGMQLTQALALEAALGGATTQGDDGGDGTLDAVAALPMEKLPTQVKLVELLQFVLDRTSRKLRVAVIISAWDIVTGSGAPLSPRAFLLHELPLLRQLLDSNCRELEYAVFGVSAQGGDVTIPEGKAALLEIDALERIQVRQDNEVTHDITRPIAWLLEEK